ncbi:dihydrodipicolinate synthase family protein [Kaistia terrae]|uniref:Dihydrodipicolinate synthase family protein n=1 Tax=Kaistia terrae TaxID=537017 RepID=A0ABW0PUM8_9HYPH|nr:dihydrodipicolinate synthase family protein [Kaistia terrae]MCX5577198.1 dihydrodipicolinate synthase family protein [Kaistia terrae]
MSFAISGVNCAAATPFNADLSPDLGLFAEHCQRLLDMGCHGIALLGTTGEANSLSLAERKTILEAALGAGIAPDQLIPGTGVAAIPETVELTRHALANGVTRVVMLPPYYYKGVSDDGLFAAYARIIEAVGDDRLRIILYHIPQVSGVPLSRSLVARLIAAFPDIVVGIKDSSGDLANMQAMVADHPGFAVLAGADPLLLPLLGSGGAGCITATSNLVADSLRAIYDGFREPSVAEPAQARINAWRSLSNSYVQIPAIKAMIGVANGETGWERVRPPLLPLSPTQLDDLRAKVAELP